MNGPDIQPDEMEDRDVATVLIIFGVCMAIVFAVFGFAVAALIPGGWEAWRIAALAAICGFAVPTVMLVFFTVGRHLGGR